MKTIALTISTVLAFALAGCGSIDEVPVTDDAKTSTIPGVGTGGTDTTMTPTGGTMTVPTTDGATTTETKPTDGNLINNMSTTEEIIASLKVVPSRVIFVVGNPQDFGGAKYGYDTFFFPIGKKCINSAYGNNTAMIWLGGKWQSSVRRVSQPSGIDSVVNNPVYIQRIASSDELAADKVAMTNPSYPADRSPLTVDLWKAQNKDALSAAIDKANATQSNLTCTEP